MSAPTTARFELERRRQLKALFTRQRLADLWRSLVKEQMRAFDITDLHDYYDFNYAIEARAVTLVERVLAGQYRAEPPLVYRLEKKLGVCRHMMIPVPSDALVFQLLTDSLYSAIMRANRRKVHITLAIGTPCNCRTNTAKQNHTRGSYCGRNFNERYGGSVAHTDSWSQPT